METVVVYSASNNTNKSSLLVVPGAPVTLVLKPHTIDLTVTGFYNLGTTTTVYHDAAVTNAETGHGIIVGTKVAFTQARSR